MTSIKRNLIRNLTILSIVSMGLFSCGPASLVNDFDCFDSLEDFQTTFQGYLASLQALGLEGQDGGAVSDATCNQFKSDSRAYIRSLEGYIDCIDGSNLVTDAELKDFKESLREAETELDMSDCN